MTKLIDRSTAIPTKAQDACSAEDGQPPCSSRSTRVGVKVRP